MWLTFVLNTSFNRRIQLKLTTVKFTQDVSHLFYLCCNSWVLTHVIISLRKYHVRLDLCLWRMCIHWWLMSPLVEMSSFPSQFNYWTHLARWSASLFISVLFNNSHVHDRWSSHNEGTCNLLLSLQSYLSCSRDGRRVGSTRNQAWVPDLAWIEQPLAPYRRLY